MESFDVYTVAALLTVCLLVAGVALVSFNNQITRLEELLEREAKETNYYSKESLDRLEEIFALRQQVEELKQNQTLGEKLDASNVPPVTASKKSRRKNS
jgi:hypothetical protein